MTSKSHQQPIETGNVCLQDAKCVAGFIVNIWNQNRYSEISDYLHDFFIDHSMPYSFLQNKEGLLIYLKEMAVKISHHTEIIKIEQIDDFVFCKIRIHVLDLSGTLAASEEPEIIEGYRLFRMLESKIAAHWEML